MSSEDRESEYYVREVRERTKMVKKMRELASELHTYSVNVL